MDVGRYGFKNQTSNFGYKWPSAGCRAHFGLVSPSQSRMGFELRMSLSLGWFVKIGPRLVWDSCKLKRPSADDGVGVNGFHGAWILVVVKSKRHPTIRYLWPVGCEEWHSNEALMPYFSIG
ncbi:hypothetical protein R6Q59_011602 [Mikania micrantha]|uniref:Uncharacterized protein n=1 Tax=Mikania micrantha TaxID=192012 RepID=A0A5N6N2F1_9ASTR|nr:hypothetical protein E3N88_24522 [Mikania micrantha]